MNFKHIAKVGSIVLVLMAIFQGVLIYLMNDEDVQRQTLVSKQFEKTISHQAQVLQDAINLSGTCNEQVAKKMQLSYPVQVSEIGLSVYANYTHDSTSCLQSLILAAVKKDPAFYQNAIAMLMLQELKVSSLTSAAIKDEQLNKKNKILLEELSNYLEIAQENTDAFWKQYYSHQESNAKIFGFGFLNFSALNRIKNNKERYAQINEKTQSVINSLKYEIKNSELTLKNESEKISSK